MVSQVAAGPKASSAAKAVKIFITEAGFIGVSLFKAMVGCVLPTARV